MSNSPLQKTVGDAPFTSQKFTIIEYVCRSPITEISGKVISSGNFAENRELPIVSPNKLKNTNDIYNNVIYTKKQYKDKEGEFTILSKQKSIRSITQLKNISKRGQRILINLIILENMIQFLIM